MKKSEIIALLKEKGVENPQGTNAELTAQLAEFDKPKDKGDGKKPKKDKPRKGRKPPTEMVGSGYANPSDTLS